MQVPFAPGPSKFRGCALDTHDSLPAHDHRPPADCSYAQRMEPRRKVQVNAAACLKKALGPEEHMPHTELNDLQAEKLQAERTSKWALLDTFEAHLCNDNRARRAQHKAETCAEMRAFLDSQMQVCAHIYMPHGHMVLQDPPNLNADASSARQSWAAHRAYICLLEARSILHTA